MSTPSVAALRNVRNARDSAAYLLPHIHANSRILDVGSGPGTITADFAELVYPGGSVVGVDSEPLFVRDASRTHASRTNLRFEVGDVMDRLPFDDDSFDIVHAHQVLQHVRDPVAALREMRRVCRRGGIVAARDADYHGMSWAPKIDGLDLWMTRYQQSARRCGGDPNAGRSLLAYAHAAGFTDVHAGASVRCFADAAGRAWWGTLWADIVQNSRLSYEMQKAGTTSEELAKMSAAWKKWAAHPDGFFVAVHGEIICVA